MGRPPAAQLADLENGRADIVSLAPTDARRVVERDLRIIASRPIELVALVFESHRAGDSLNAWRGALASSFNRSTMSSALLQQYGSPSEGALPSWLSGYRLAAAPPPLPSLTRAQIAALAPELRSPIVRISPSDPLARAILDRVAVDAREHGFSIVVQAPTGLAPRADARLVRLELKPTTPERAFGDLVTRLGARVLDPAAGGMPEPGAPLETVYQAERSLLDSFVVVPIVHVADVYGVGPAIDAWTSRPVRASGAWDFANLWLHPGKP
jgi:hypothetical protein